MVITQHAKQTALQPGITLRDLDSVIAHVARCGYGNVEGIVRWFAAEEAPYQNFRDGGCLRPMRSHVPVVTFTSRPTIELSR